MLRITSSNCTKCQKNGLSSETALMSRGKVAAIFAAAASLGAPASCPTIPGPGGVSGAHSVVTFGSFGAAAL